MAFFNFRKQVDSHDASPDRHEAVESVETLRKKALHRLIGSAILVVIGVIVFSLVFDRQPRPIPVDIAIQIPTKEGQPPLVIGSASQAAQVTAPEPALAASTPAAVSVAASVAPKASLGPKEELLAAPTKPAAASKPAAAAAPLLESKDNAKATEAQKVKDLLDGKLPTASASAPVATGERFVVQVGAFADAAKARQARLKVEKAGLKTYTQVAETAEGKRIRVRVGPFASRDEADKAAKKIKSLDLAANILTL